jgi:energy-coupling factor transporter transmembrane protein EcfT
MNFKINFCKILNIFDCKLVIPLIERGISNEQFQETLTNCSKIIKTKLEILEKKRKDLTVILIIVFVFWILSFYGGVGISVFFFIAFKLNPIFMIISCILIPMIWVLGLYLFYYKYYLCKTKSISENFVQESKNEINNLLEQENLKKYFNKGIQFVFNIESNSQNSISNRFSMINVYEPSIVLFFSQKIPTNITSK